MSGCKNPWSLAEDRIVRENYPKHGLFGPWRKKLDRSDAAVAHRVARLKVKGPPRGSTNVYWTDDEVNALRRHYPEHGVVWDGWKDALPDRTTSQIRNKAIRLGLLKDKERCGAAWRDTAAVTEEPWTQTQRQRLVASMHEMCDETGHTVMECMREFWRIWLERQKNIRG